MGSLVKKVTSGSLNSVSKISDSLAGGLSALTDNEFKEERKQLIYVENGIVANFKEGFNSFGVGLKSAVTGLYQQPIKGWHKRGLIGIYTGTVDGVTGLIVKPVTGTLDLLS